MQVREAIEQRMVFGQGREAGGQDRLPASVRTSQARKPCHKVADEVAAAKDQSVLLVNTEGSISEVHALRDGKVAFYRIAVLYYGLQYIPPNPARWNTNAAAPKVDGKWTLLTDRYRDPSRVFTEDHPALNFIQSNSILMPAELL